MAPVAGRVGLRLVDPGNYVQASDTNGIVIITQLDPISVLFSVPEDNLPEIADQVQAGVTLQATAFDRANITKLAVGNVTTLDNTIDPTTGTLKLRAQFDNKNDHLFPNQFVNIRLLVRTEKNVVTVPTAAVQNGAPGTYVYLINADNTVAVHPIKLGVTEGGMVAVDTGLKEGDRVVVDGSDRLRDGAHVRVVQPGNAAATPPAAGPATPDTHRHRRSGAKPDAQ